MPPGKSRIVESQGLLFHQERGGLKAGLDEAGRGCLAGPVVAAAVIFPDDFDIIGLDDSKVLKEAERVRLAAEIRELALGWGIGLVWMAEIQRQNILQATLLAMARALAALRKRMGVLPAELIPVKLLIDGNQILPLHYLDLYRIPRPEQKAVVDGDALIPSISAASVLAKTFRDNLMTGFDARWPKYGFARHKGYGSKEHRAALEKFGPCPLHRLDFKGVLPDTTPKQGWLC